MRLFPLLEGGQIHLDGKKVIKSKDVELLLSAEQIVLRAQEEVKRVYSSNQLECSKLRDKAKEEGFAAGLESFHEHLLYLEAQVRVLKSELRRSLLPLAIGAAKKIVAGELSLHPEKIVDIAIRAAKPISQSSRVRVIVSKEDIPYLEQGKEKLRNVFPQLEILSIEEREDITPGSCLIETEKGIVNASLEQQWNSLQRALAKYER